MIILFLKEYKIWYINYLLFLVLNLLVFYLYRFPIHHFFITSLISVTILLLFSFAAYLKFKRKILALQEFIYVKELSVLNSPTELAFKETLMTVLDREAEKHQELARQTDHLDELIKLWAHQMKLPLSVLSLMEQSGQIDSLELKNQIFRMENYLNQLLNYMKFSQNNDDFRFERVSLREISQTILKQMRYSCITKGISVELEGDWQLSSDKKWLKFVLEQILDNAIKYSRKNGQIKILIKDCSIRISDKGIGILESDLPRLFEEGFTGYNGHEHQKASGLGLYMAKTILEKLNLDLSVESELDKGTSVTILRK
ncbi:sensor histidine kinase [Streptococcus catagoni]|uniref:sensor histidine kinase n=1 Tax=Streptococcus catagoni TaxID=2654874 RepID=UPI00140A9BE7|nr:sensor histidine kinase [Streptococcus catagoni]